MNNILEKSFDDLKGKNILKLISIIVLIGVIVILEIGFAYTELPIFPMVLPFLFIPLFWDTLKSKKENCIPLLITGIIYIIITLVKYRIGDYIFSLDSNAIYIVYETTFNFLLGIVTLGIFYSCVGNLESKFPIVDIFRYFSQKSTRLYLIFGSILYIFYDNYFWSFLYTMEYSLLQILLLIGTTIFISIFILIFKNFIERDEKDEVILKLKGKKLKYFGKSFLVSLLVVIFSVVISFITIFTSIFVSYTSNSIGAVLLIIFLLILGAIGFVVVLSIVQLCLSKFSLEYNGKTLFKFISFKKIVKTSLIDIFFGVILFLIITFGCLVLIGVLGVDINNAYDVNGWEYFSLGFIYVTLGIILVLLDYFGVVLSFQLLGIVTDKRFSISFRDGFKLTNKLVNWKTIFMLFMYNVLLTAYLLMVENSNFITTILNILGLYIFFYIGNYYIEETESKESFEYDEEN